MAKPAIFNILQRIKRKHDTKVDPLGAGMPHSLAEYAQAYARKKNKNVVFDLVRNNAQIPRNYEAPASIQSVAVCLEQGDYRTPQAQAVLQAVSEIKAAGYDVVLIVQNKLPDSLIPEDVGVEIVPSSSEDFYTRIKLLEEIAVANKVDAFVLNAWLALDKYWDYLVIKNPISMALEKDIQVLLQLHGSFEGPQNKPRSQYWYFQAEAMGAFDGIIALSEVDQYFWNAYNTHSFVKVPPVYGGCEYPLQAACKGACVLHVFERGWEKSQGDMLRAMKQVLKEVPQAQLVLYGDTSDEWNENRAVLIEELGLTDQVRFEQSLSESERAVLFSQAAVVVNTALHDGYPFLAAEAKSCGVPLISYELPSCTLLFDCEKNGSVVVGQGNVAELASSIGRVLTDADYRAELSRAAYRQMEAINKQDTAAIWNKIFESCLEPKEAFNDKLQLAVYRNIILATRRSGLALNKKD